jgi:hypothetical protein
MQEEAETSIIKSDRVGRAQYSRDYKNQVLAAFEQSGMSGAAFAEQCGVKYPTFASWVAKARKKHDQQGESRISVQATTDLSARHRVGIDCSILLAAMASGVFRLLGWGRFWGFKAFW